MAVGTYEEPLRGYNFQLDTGSAVGHFTEISGLAARVAPIPYRAGGQAGGSVLQLPGPVEYAPVVLRYGLTTSRSLWDWMSASMAGVVDRRTVVVAHLDNEGSVVTRYVLENAWPCEWRAAPLDALGREVAIETLALTLEGLKREDAPPPEPST